MSSHSKSEITCERPKSFGISYLAFWQGSDREANGELDWIKRALALNTPQQRVIIKRFLGELLDRNADVSELQRAWLSGSARYFILDEHIRWFFEQIRASIKD